jgi:uncharacterized membrane protein
MKVVKIILGVILSLILLVLIIALFVDKEYSIRREIVINRPRAEVFDYVKHLKNQDNYNAWVRIDPDMKKVFRGTDGTVGFVYAWDSEIKSAGKGEQEIKNIIEGEKVDIEVRFEKPFEGVAYTPITTTDEGGATRVSWGMNGRSAYPMNFMNLCMGSMLGDKLDESLRDLKNILEKK